MSVTEDILVIQRLQEVVNRAIASDPEAMKALILLRVPCNKELANDPTIQVRDHKDGTYSISPLGLICGIAGSRPDGMANVVARFQTVCPVHGQVDEQIDKPCPVEGCLGVVELGKFERLGSMAQLFYPEKT